MAATMNMIKRSTSADRSMLADWQAQQHDGEDQHDEADGAGPGVHRQAATDEHHRQQVGCQQNHCQAQSGRKKFTNPAQTPASGASMTRPKAKPPDWDGSRRERRWRKPGPAPGRMIEKPAPRRHCQFSNWQLYDLVAIETRDAGDHVSRISGYA